MAQNLHVFALTARVQISGGSREESYPIIGFDLRTAFNAIPEVSLILATGINLDTMKVSKAHSLLKDGKLHAQEYSRISLYVTNLATHEEQMVFDGILTDPVTSYANQMTSITLSARHWAEALDLHPFLASSIHKESSVEKYSVPILDMYKRQEGEEIITSIAAWADKTMPPSGAQGLFQSTLYPFLKEFLDRSKFPIVWLPNWLKNTSGTSGHLRSFDDMLPAEFRINALLGKEGGEAVRVKSLSPGADPAIEFPGLHVRNVSSQNSLTLDMVMRHAAKQIASSSAVQGRSFFSLLLDWGAAFSYIVVPRVSELRLIPFQPVYKPDDQKIKMLTGPISVGTVLGGFRPIGMVLVLPESSGLSGSLPAQVNPRPIDNWGFETAYAGGFALDSLPGTLLIVKAPSWLSSHHQGMPYTKPTHDTAVPSFRPFADLMAKDAYLIHRYKSASVQIVSPIRFDIGVGSTIRFRTGSEGIFGHGAAAANVTCDGYVLNARHTFDKMNSAALSHFTVGYVRPIAEYDLFDQKKEISDLFNEIPYYEGKPFGHAPWTDKEFNLNVF
jgi:hypothetical protein